MNFRVGEPVETVMQPVTIYFSDPGMRLRSVVAPESTLESALTVVRAEVRHYTRARVCGGGNALAFCTREVGESDWKVLIPRKRSP
jgi:hypothetical protein